MRITLIKGLMLMALGMMAGGIFAPWIISNNVLPLWINIVLLSSMIFAGICLVEFLYRKLFKSIKDEYERTGSE